MADLPEQIRQALAPQTAPADPSGHKKTGGFISPIVADVIGGVSSLLVGGITAWQLIAERAYKNMSSLNLFEDIKIIVSGKETYW